MFNKIVAEKPADKIAAFFRHPLRTVCEAIDAHRQAEQQALESYAKQAALLKEIINSAVIAGTAINPRRRSTLRDALQMLEFIIYKETDKKIAGLAREILDSILEEEQRIDQKYRVVSPVWREQLKQNIPAKLIERGESAERILRRR
ncbi:MAG: hypothetical protein LBD99_00040 [Candidatus Margulisbacteria bacterium]|jgi:hypothetical protein|nr:hypothetical protein [Candidatus Margulisiibacteriota bacterium]